MPITTFRMVETFEEILFKMINLATERELSF